MKRWLIPTLGLLLAGVMAVAAAADAFLPVFGGREPSAQQRHSITLSRGQTPSFNPDELERRLGLAAESLRAVTFTRLPDPESGVLMLKNHPVAPYVSIPRRQLSSLVFLSTGQGEASFTLLPDANAGAAATLAYTTLAEPNSPPVVENAGYSTLQGVRRYGGVRSPL